MTALASRLLAEIDELRLGLGQIAVRVMDDPVMATCCCLIDAKLAMLTAAPSAKGVANGR